MESLKNLVRKIVELIMSFFSDILDGISEGIEEVDVGKVAKGVTFLCVVCSLFLLLGYFLVILALRNSVYLTILGFLAAGAYSLLRKISGAVEPEPIHVPTMSDYTAVLETLKPALAKVAPALGLAPIYSYTDITLNEDETITKWGKVWRMGYGTLKKTAGVDVNTDMCRRVIQAQVKTVLERENPSGFSNVRFPRGGRFEPIIQIDEVMQDDAYVYIFSALASDAYFSQKAEWESRRNLLTMGADTDDEDF